MWATSVSLCAMLNEESALQHNNSLKTYINSKITHRSTLELHIVWQRNFRFLLLPPPPPPSLPQNNQQMKKISAACQARKGLARMLLFLVLNEQIQEEFSPFSTVDVTPIFRKIVLWVCVSGSASFKRLVDGNRRRAGKLAL